MKPALTNEDYARAAALLGCSVAAIRAVCQVEAPRGGFLADDRPVILFEGHYFHRLTGGAFDKTAPTVSYPTWTRQFYSKSGAGEWERLSAAIALDRPAALKSASWGRFQIMGENYRFCGFDSVQAFVNAMYASEGAQLDAFVQFVLHRGLNDELRDQRWADFARLYNGPAYAKNRYDTKLADAYKSYA
jgi:hypothetical protein